MVCSAEKKLSLSSWFTYAGCAADTKEVQLKLNLTFFIELIHCLQKIVPFDEMVDRIHAFFYGMQHFGVVILRKRTQHMLDYRHIMLGPSDSDADPVEILCA